MIVAGSALVVYRLNITPARSLVNFKIASQEFEQDKDQQKFEHNKRLIQDYYTSGAYERDVSKITKEAELAFSKVPVKENSIVIFDIDDTALYNYQRMDRLDFIWSHQPTLLEARKNNKSLAILPVLELYKSLVKQGFKIVFLSSRNEGSYAEYAKDLESVGYTTYERIILMPDKLAFDLNIKTADWKLEMRKKLAKKYSIEGSIGDRDVDFFGGFTGYAVKLPNYLY